MKILYSQIKQFIPGLKADAKTVAHHLTMNGFMADSFAEVKYQGKNDYLIGLEVRQNRPDCLAAFGIAREVAAYFGLKTNLPEAPKLEYKASLQNIKVNAEKDVKRVLAVEITGIKNGASPAWLKEFLALYEVNSINLLVDLSNYAMLLTGYPSHIIDTNKTSGQIKWEVNKKFTEVITLDGSKINLKKNEIIISDDKNIVALAGIVGSRYAEVDSQTNSIIAEAAIYKPATIRQNARSLSIATEASTRLEKELDENGSQAAFELLVSLILKYCGGKVTKPALDYYPHKRQSPEIKFDPARPSVVAGIEITAKEAKQALENLRFKILENKDAWLVNPPLDRTDVGLEEDVIEEVIRLVGFEKIPIDQIPAFGFAPDITPKTMILAEKIRDNLTANGFDEILSLTLSPIELNNRLNYQNWDIIKTQNSINEEYPALRQSIITGLTIQMDEYLKNNIEFIDIFEIGKVFGKKNNKYEEFLSLGILSCKDKKDLTGFKLALDRLLQSLGLEEITYQPAKKLPAIANPDNGWDIFSGKENIGIMYKFKPDENKISVYAAEINLDTLTGILLKLHLNPIVEITTKNIPLDANVELSQGESIVNYLQNIKTQIKPENIWSIAVVDTYKVSDKKTRYTVRVSYKNLSDQEAKELHLKVFKLKA